jgi:hypothetical protein
VRAHVSIAVTVWLIYCCVQNDFKMSYRTAKKSQNTKEKESAKRSN